MTQLLNMLRLHEGLRLKPYSCSGGKRTIGYGWNMSDNALPVEIALHLHIYGEITKDQAEDLLIISAKRAQDQCRTLYKGYDSFTQNRQDALADFVFNVGIGTAKKFRKANKAINEGRWNDAADEMMDSLWYRQVPNRAKEIVKMIREG